MLQYIWYTVDAQSTTHIHYYFHINIIVIITVIGLYIVKRSFKEAMKATLGQESLACCSPWGYRESDTTE